MNEIERFYWLYNTETGWACHDCKTPWLCNPKNGYCIDCVSAKLLASIAVRCKTRKK